MSSIYDNWERLVEAVMHRELFRELSLCDSLSSTSCNSSTDSNNLYKDISHPTRSPLHPDAESMNQGKKSVTRELPEKKRNPIWKGLSIFKSFSLKRGYGREERELKKAKAYGREQRELKWADAQKTLHGLKQAVTQKTLHGLPPNPATEIAEAVRRKADIARLREMLTLKGHIEAVLRMKNIDLDLIPCQYTL